MKISMGSPTAALGLLAAGALVLSACGGGESEAGTDDEIASLDDATGDDDTVAAESNDGASVDDVEQAALDFSECLRGEGVDIPDIGVDADGNINLRDAMQSTELDRETMRGAMEACGEPVPIEDQKVRSSKGSGSAAASAARSPTTPKSPTPSSTTATASATRASRTSLI